MVVFTLRGAATYGHSVILARIGNSIVAENQRRLFDRLQQQNLTYFGERHSSELLARLSTGATAANQALNLVITAIGRDFLTLTALTVVMFVQDPIMSLVVFVVVPPVVLALRKLVKRIKNVALNQWQGGAQTLETLQETVQGIRLVKSFTLEEQMRARFDANVAGVQAASNKMARVSNRTAPLIETLAGLAIAVLMVYAGHRVINTGASPGEFFSFITAFLLAYEPAKRLARLNLDLNVALVNVRVLFDVIDSPATEPADEDRPRAEGHHGAPRVPRRVVLIPARRADDPEHVVRRGARPHDGAGRPVGRRQVHGAESDLALLRRRRRRHHASTIRTSRRCRAVRCAARSPMSGRTFFCSAPRSARTSHSAAPARPTPTSSRPPRRRRHTISSARSRTVTTPWSKNADRGYRAASASASPLPARSSRMRR